jgi:DNA-binding transcriptional LysR family regulator
MELRQLQCFVAVAEALNFRRAAERLHVTQPSVSRHVRQLEEELGAVLLLRDRRRVQLTENGRSVLTKAQALLADAAALAESVDRTVKGAPARLKVGVSIPLVKSIQGLVTEYARQFPHVDVQYQDILQASMHNKGLRKGEIDIGISWPPIDRTHISSERLFDERFRVILPRTSPLARHKKLRFRELAEQVLLLPEQTETSNRKVLQMARDAGVTLKVARTTALPHEAGAALVAAGKGIYVLAGSPLKFPSFGTGITTIPLDEPMALEVHIAWRKGENSPTVLSFLEVARRVFQCPASAAGGAA